MDFILPTPITDALFVSSDVVENDYQAWDNTTAYSIGDKVIVTTPDIHKIYECIESQVGGLVIDLCNDECTTLSGWSLGRGGNASLPEVSPAGQIKFATNTHIAGNSSYMSKQFAAPPNTFTLEVKLYFDKIGNTGSDYFKLEYGNTTWKFQAIFSTVGLFIYKAAGAYTEVGSDIVKSGATAIFQTYRFQITKTIESAATVEVFLKEEGGLFSSQGTFDCDYETGMAFDGYMTLSQLGFNTDNLITHLDYVKMGTGLGRLTNTGDSPDGNEINWLEISATNRWKCFDETIGVQTEQETSMNYILTPGAIDSVALLNLESTSVQIKMTDPAHLGADAMSGSVSQANMKISSIDGAAHVDFGVAGILSEGVSENAKLEITDSAGKKIVGFIKALGTGETLGSELLDAWANRVGYAFETFSVSGTDITQAINAAGGYGMATKDLALAGALLKIVNTGYTLNSGTEPSFYLSSASFTRVQDLTKLATQYKNVKDTVTMILIGAPGQVATDFALTGNSFKQVLTPSATGVRITSTQGGTTYNWASKEAGFDFNDPAGYTYKISVVYNETVTTGASKTDVVKLDLPIAYSTAKLSITVNHSTSLAKLGELIVGVKTNIGTMKYSPSVGITDYSTKEVDTFGHYSIVPRTFAKRMTCSLFIPNTIIDEVIRLLTLYRSTELVWVGDDSFNSLIVYGFYKDFQVVFSRPVSSDCALEIEGLT